jgi:hypothetical protein
MKNFHVCLISDQTIPNILSIWKFQPDFILFISTSQMEDKNKTHSIIETLKILDSKYDNVPFETITVDSNSISDCRRKLVDWLHGKEENKFVVNVTGGTKIMSLSAFEVFKEYQSEIIYLPFPKNEYSIIFPKKSDTALKPIELRLNVKQYLSAYGLKIFNEEKLVDKKQKAFERAELSAWIVKNYKNLLNLLERFGKELRDHRKDKTYEWHTDYKPENAQEVELFKRLGFELINKTYKKVFKKNEIEYLTGGWLEEYCFVQLSNFLGKGIDDLWLNVEAGAGEIKNEYDVLFTKDNSFYTLECKSLSQSHDLNGEILYKIGALQNNFGLNTKGYLVTTSPHILNKNGEIKTSIKERAEKFRTKVIKPDEVPNFAEIIAEDLKLRA